MREGNGHSGRSRKPSPRVSRLVSDQMGRRRYSIQALLERVEREFIEEYSGSDVLQQAETPTERLKLVRDTVNYVLSIESVQLGPDETADLIRQAYSSLFGYGPLDALFLDADVTTIAIDGADTLSVRRGHGDMEPAGVLFEDAQHLTRIVRRLLVDAGTDFSEDVPIIETGLAVGSRPVCLSLIAPPLTINLNVDIRVHPAKPVTMSDLVSSGFLTEQAGEVLRVLAESSHGVVIVGDTESGKTTLLNAFAYLLPDPGRCVAVERAGEMRLPDDMSGFSVRWPGPNTDAMTFGEQINAALEREPACLLLDEVRADEPHTIAPLLRDSPSPRQIWSFRGPFDAKRLRSALSMLARRSDVGQGETLVQALYQRLPFVVTVWRARGQIGLYSIAEWQFRQSDYPDYVLLASLVDGELRLTGERPQRTLDLPGDFWS